MRAILDCVAWRGVAWRGVAWCGGPGGWLHLNQRPFPFSPASAPRLLTLLAGNYKVINMSWHGRSFDTLLAALTERSFEATHPAHVHVIDFGNGCVPCS